MAKKKTSLGCLFWIALALLLIVLFISQRKAIESGWIKLTQFIGKNTPTKTQLQQQTPTAKPTQKPEQEVVIRINQSTKPVVNSEKPNRETPKNSQKLPIATIKPTPTATKTVQPNPTKTVKQITRISKLYFVRTHTDGTAILIPINRKIEYSDSPLSVTIESLCTGMTLEEQQSGLFTMLPAGTKLLSARIQNNTAYLNFSDAFRFNPLGKDGFTIQLKQIVYTTTEFSNVTAVQILIQNKIIQYLDAEGLFIGAPLSRSSF